MVSRCHDVLYILTKYYWRYGGIRDACNKRVPDAPSYPYATLHGYSDTLCSLNPGVDRLGYLRCVQDGELLFKNLMISGLDVHVIHSCIKMHYELAGEIIQDPSRDWSEDLKGKVFGQTSQVCDRICSRNCK